MDRDLFDLARAIRDRAHAPYSRFAVGAALRSGAGTTHAGCNVENASYPEGWCAETSAIAAMVCGAGTAEGRRIEEVVVVAEPVDGRMVSPCGGCRQRLAEFGMAGTVVHLVDPAGERTETYRLGELLPAAFAMPDEP